MEVPLVLNSRQQVPRAYCPNIYTVNPGFTPSSISGLEFCPTSRRWFSHSKTKGTIAKKSKKSTQKKRKSKSKSLNKNVQKKPLKNIDVNSAFSLDIQSKKSTQQFQNKKPMVRGPFRIQISVKYLLMLNLRSCFHICLLINKN